jgi:hypothetical protein
MYGGKLADHLNDEKFEAACGRQTYGLRWLDRPRKGLPLARNADGRFNDGKSISRWH